ncbi:ABC transporter permease [Brevibacterium sp.]|uniref:ABC transporter permease n=1 Tax=Brevibacterium sp. TaxID=1701 RepID=UPI002811F1A7|nr:ABC transporter permease [Brevibacterium sp.]
MSSVSALAAALSVESLKLRRSLIARVAGLLLIVLVPTVSVGAVALARSPLAVGAASAKLAPYSTGDLVATHLLVCGQVLSIGSLFAAGFVLAWSFGREFESGSAGALFALTVPRATIALAKALVVLAWSGLCVLVTVALTLAASAAVAASAGASFAGAWSGAGIALASGLLGTGLALPFGWLATITRSQLGTVGCLVGVVALTQIVVLLGGGPWFPYAVPSLWTGMGGAASAAAIGLPHLLTAAAVTPVSLFLIVHSWRRLTNV